MTPEERQQLQEWIENSAVREYEWKEAKVNLQKTILYLRKEHRIEDLREISFEMVKVITQLMEAAKKQNDDVMAYVQQRLKE